MKQYRKKPLTVEAHQFQGNVFDMPEWLLTHAQLKGTNSKGELIIKSKHGTVHAGIGDYVILSQMGEIYPCTAPVFEASYEPVGT